MRERNNSSNPQPGDRPKPRWGILGRIFGRKGRWVCRLGMDEVEGMKYARKHGSNYRAWKLSIIEERNLLRSDFWVDEKTGDLYYPE